jgi:hypothetical protein
MTNASDFLAALFPETGTRALIELRCWDQQKSVRQRWFQIPGAPEALLIEAQSLREAHDVYIGVAARVSESGTAAATAYVNAFFADDDGTANLENFPKPSIVVNSGRNRHLYWLLKTPWTVRAPQDLAGFEALNKGIAAHIGADNCSDIAHVYRLPGTLNHKPGGPYPVEIIEFHRDRRFDPQTFEKYRGARRVPKPSPSGRGPIVGAATHVWADQVPLGVRNETQFAESCDLAEAGVDQGQAVAIMRRRFAEHYEPGGPGKEKDMLATIKSAYQYVERRHERTREAAGVGAAHARGDTPQTRVGLSAVRVADIEREEVRWRWLHRLPEGKLTLVEGDPDQGKSFMTLAIATAVSLGVALPGDEGDFPPRGVLLFSAEDGKADTVRPRLEDMGADLTRVWVVDGCVDADGKKRWPNLKDDLLHIEAVLAGGDIGLVVVDPINAYMGETDGNKDIAIRGVLGPLAELAERHGVIMLCIRHLTKQAPDHAIYRGQGSIAYTAAARSVLLVGRPQEEGADRCVLCIKHNLAPESAAGRFFWKGEIDTTAEQLLAPEGARGKRSVIDDAIAFLQDVLSDGEDHLSNDLIDEAKRELDIGRNALFDAKKALGVEAFRKNVDAGPGKGSGRGAAWFWRFNRLTVHSIYSKQLNTQIQDESPTRLEAEDLTVYGAAFCRHCGGSATGRDRVGSPVCDNHRPAFGEPLPL